MDNSIGITVVVVGKSGKNISAKKNDKTGNVRLGGSSPIKHDIFKFFSEIAESKGHTEWVHFFETMAKGSFWRGVEYKGETLKIKQKPSNKTLYLPYCDDMNINNIDKFLDKYEECKLFLMKNTSHFLVHEEQLIDVADDIQDEPTIDSSVTLKHGTAIRELFIQEFAVRMGKEYDLSLSCVKALVSSIFTKLSSKELTSKSFVMYDDNRIESIHGLNLSSGTYMFGNPMYKNQEVCVKRRIIERRC